MRSSSGVSSTGSLHLSIGSEWEEQQQGKGELIMLKTSMHKVNLSFGRLLFLNRQALEQVPTFGSVWCMSCIY